jgi:hypothetical protein
MERRVAIRFSAPAASGRTEGAVGVGHHAKSHQLPGHTLTLPTPAGKVKHYFEKPTTVAGTDLAKEVWHS